LLSRSRIPVIHAHVTKLINDYDFFPVYELWSNVYHKALPVMKDNANHMLRLKKSSSTEFLYYNLALQTLADQQELEEIIDSTLGIDTTGKTIRCPNCRQLGAKVWYSADEEHEVLPEFRLWLVRCEDCGYEGVLSRKRFDDRGVELEACRLRLYLEKKLPPLPS
jgi:DNA-directed RNA polymerase subunit RPC12/RpoP